MTFFVKSNNVYSSLRSTLASGILTLNVTVGDGSKFPSTFPYILTIWNPGYSNPGDDPNMEIVWCIGKAIDDLTIERAKESTSDVSHHHGHKVALLVTSGLLNDATYGIEGNIITHETDVNAHHTQIHTIVSHDTDATGSELNELTDGSQTALHSHAGGGSGDVATDTIWDTKGDLAVGTGSDTAIKLPSGTNGYVLVVDPNEPTGLKWVIIDGGDAN